MADKDNSGALFKNDRKETDNHPDYRGNATVDGVDYWMSAWVNKPEGKQAYMSVAFTPKEPTSSRTGDPVDGDDMPF